MDKFAIITQALMRLGEREYKQGSAVYEPARIFFPVAMREANARHNWSFARRLFVPLRPLAKHEHHGAHAVNAPERHEKAPRDHVGHHCPREHEKRREGAFKCVFVVPEDCLRIIGLYDKGFRKVDTWHLGVDPDTQQRVIYAPEAAEPRLTYVADLVAAGGCIPDHAPLYCAGVVSLLAARLAPAILGNEQIGQQLQAEAERYLQEAILQDRRQDASNDQHPLRSILERDILSEHSASIIYYI